MNVFRKCFLRTQLYTRAESQRFRWSWMSEKKPYYRKYPYKDPLEWKNELLPRIKNSQQRINIPTYAPKDAWSEKKALLGQNDYIDILGDGTIHPSRLLSHVPWWLRGFKGIKYPMFLRKRRMLGYEMKYYRPSDYNTLNKRIWHWYKFLNHKTKTRRT